MTGWTTLLAWVGIRWPGSGPVPQRATRIFPVEQSTPDVPREYRALYTYLENRYASVVVLTFEQMESLLGFALPTTARTECEWWTNTASAQHQSAAWIQAGRTAAPNFGARTTTFERLV